MNPRTATVTAAMLAAVAFGQEMSDQPIKPVTVCDVLSDPTRMNGKSVAVVGRLEQGCYESRLVAEHCEQPLVMNGHVWPNSLSLDGRGRLGPYPPGGSLILDSSASAQKIREARESALKGTDEVWTVFYGKIQTREDLEAYPKAYEAFYASGGAPASLVLSNFRELNFTSEGRPVEIVRVGNCLIMINEPIRATLCELMKTPEHYYGRPVEVRSAISRFGADGSALLFDRACSANLRFEVTDLQMIGADASYQRLDRYLSEGHVVDATVSGTFELVLALGDPRSNYTRIAARSVSDVVLEPHQDGGK